MAEPDAARRVTLADQALIHIAAYLALTVVEDATWETFRRELAEILPRVNRGIPAIERLAELCDGLVDPQNRAAVGQLKDRIQNEIRDYHQAKSARAIDALRTAATEGQGAA